MLDLEPNCTFLNLSEENQAGLGKMYVD